MPHGHNGKEPTLTLATSSWPLQWGAYVLAILATTLTMCISLGMAKSSANAPALLFFLVSIILSAYFGGLGPGLIATVLAATFSALFLYFPSHAAPGDFETESLWWGLLIVAGMLVSVMSEGLHRSRRRAEDSMRWYAVTLSSIGDAVITTDSTGRVTFLNATAERLTGWNNADAKGQALYGVCSIIDETARLPVADPVERVLASGRLLERSNRAVLVGREGSEIPIDYNGAPIRFADGAIQGVVLVFRDCTESKRAEDALRQSQALYHSLVEQMPAGLFRKDAAGRYDFINPLCCGFAGWEAAEVIGKTAEQCGCDIFDSPPNNTGTHPVRQTLGYGLDHHGAIMRTGEVIELDVERKFADGRINHFHIVKTPVRDADGKIVGSQGIIFDVTERKRADEALRESEHKFRAVFDNARDAIFIHDVDGRLLEVNKEACDRLQFPREELLGLKVQDVNTPEKALLVPARMAHLQQHGHGLFESVHRRRDGSELPVEINSQLFALAGQNVVLSFCRDLTERRRAEVEKESLENQLRHSQKMDALGQLAAGVAHDFNNILGVIQIQTDLFKLAGNSSKAQTDLASEICRAAERAANLTRQLLLFSRRQTLQPCDLEMNGLVSSMTKMLKRILSENVELRFEHAPDPLFIRADAGMLDQVLMNLVVNARDAMPQGGQLVIATSLVDYDEAAAARSPEVRAGSFACLSVSDTGAGISKDVLARMFEPFFTTKEAGKGTGLGLATVYGIVQQHQGWIKVETELGAGTTFRVYLPRLVEAASPKTSSVTTLLRRGGAETILLVEDDSVLRSRVMHVLKRLGYRVLEAPNAEGALVVWKQHSKEINLLLTDLVMPGLPGNELAQKLLQDNPQLRVIYMSGHSPDAIGKNLNLSEVSNVLCKPFRANILTDAVRVSLDHSRTTMPLESTENN